MELSAEAALNAHDQALKRRHAEVSAACKEHMKVYQKQIAHEQQLQLQEKIKELTEKGEYMAMFTAMKDSAAATKRKMDEEQRRFMMAHGQVWDPKKNISAGDSGSGSLDSLLAQLEKDGAADGTLPMIRPGDASVAAPFTSRTPSIRAVVDLIRQGRCTLLSALMQQQIMMLESIIAAYTLSALSLHNSRSSERQMMASSWLVMTAAISFSYATPIDTMHPLRPIRSLFHPVIIISIFGQALIHIACMTLAVQWATEEMGPEKLQEVTEFFKKAKAKEIDAASLCADDDYACQVNAFWAQPFLPNLLNTVVFLVETSQMISVFFANYKGRPWMKGMLENHYLFLSVFICIGAVVVCSWEMIPELNEVLHFHPFPNDAFRYKVVLLVSATIAGTFLWDRLCTLIFAPKVFRAMTEEVAKTTLSDLVPVLTTAAKIIGVIFILATGNLLLAGGAYWVYQRWQSGNEQLLRQREKAELERLEKEKKERALLGDTAAATSTTKRK